MRTNEKLAEIADGWLVLDYNSDTELYELSLEYDDRDILEIEQIEKYSDALDAFLSYYKKNR